MTTVGHVSDLHYWAFDNVKPLELLNKRLVGGVNIALNRAKKHDNKIATLALKQLDEEKVDHIAISGDLTNLAFPCEYDEAARQVYSIEDAEHRVSIIPGNHDYYTADTVREKRFENAFASILKSDLPQYLGNDHYPYCRFVGDDVAVIGLNSGLITPPFFAQGRVKEDELSRLKALLNDSALTSRFVIVQVHHHLLPHTHKLEKMRVLINADEVLTLLRECKVPLVLHGHNHISNIDTLPHLNGDKDIVISGCSSSSYVGHKKKAHRATFNIYKVNKKSFSISRYVYKNDISRFEFWDTQKFPR